MSKAGKGRLKSRRDFLRSAASSAALAATPSAIANQGQHQHHQATSGAQSHPAQTPHLTGELSTKILPLDGPDWLIAIDPNN